MKSRVTDIPEQFPVLRMYKDASELFRAARAAVERGTSFIVMEYPAEWGDHAAMQKTRRGVSIQIKSR